MQTLYYLLSLTIQMFTFNRGELSTCKYHYYSTLYSTSLTILIELLQNLMDCEK